MGLDTYAARIAVDFFDPDLDENAVDEDFGCTEEDLAALRAAGAECKRWDGSCLFSENYFRGKIYTHLVRHITGRSLNETWIPPEDVRKMSEAFDRCDPAEAIRTYRESTSLDRGLDERTVRQLRLFFRVCAKRGLGLVGSW